MMTTTNINDDDSKNKNNVVVLTQLDRHVHIILPNNADQTASYRDGISSRLERLHRWQGVSLIRQACLQLSVGPSVMVTACTLFHRYWYQVSLHKIDVWSVAMASTLVATKLEEQPKTLYQIINVYSQIYTQRLILDGLSSNVHQRCWIMESSPPYLGSLVTIQHSQRRHQEHCHHHSQQPLNKTGPVYQDWYTAITKAEHWLLRQLGFSLYWIPDSHPHKFLLYFCQVLEWEEHRGEKVKKPIDFENDKQQQETQQQQQQQQPVEQQQQRLVQSAWNYCNDACCYLDLTLRYSAEVIACSAILCTALEMGDTRLLLLPQHLPQPWWQILIGPHQGQSLVDAANAMIGLVGLQRKVDRIMMMMNDMDVGVGVVVNTSKTNLSDNDDDHTEDMMMDWLCAKYGFVRSLIPPTHDHETSFNDPNSFLWEYQKELLEKEYCNIQYNTP